MNKHKHEEEFKFFNTIPTFYAQRIFKHRLANKHLNETFCQKQKSAE